MSDIYIEGQTFEEVDFSKRGLEEGEYESCYFINCLFRMRKERG